jgi:hypothetical protein
MMEKAEWSFDPDKTNVVGNGTFQTTVKVACALAEQADAFDLFTFEHDI